MVESLYINNIQIKQFEITREAEPVVIDEKTSITGWLHREYAFATAPDWYGANYQTVKKRIKYTISKYGEDCTELYELLKPLIGQKVALRLTLPIRDEHYEGWLGMVHTYDAKINTIDAIEITVKVVSTLGYGKYNLLAEIIKHPLEKEIGVMRISKDAPFETVVKLDCLGCVFLDNNITLGNGINSVDVGFVFEQSGSYTILCSSSNEVFRSTNLSLIIKPPIGNMSFSAGSSFITRKIGQIWQNISIPLSLFTIPNSTTAANRTFSVADKEGNTYVFPWHTDGGLETWRMRMIKVSKNSIITSCIIDKRHSNYAMYSRSFMPSISNDGSFIFANFYNGTWNNIYKIPTSFMDGELINPDTVDYEQTYIRVRCFQGVAFILYRSNGYRIKIRDINNYSKLLNDYLITADQVYDLAVDNNGVAFAITSNNVYKLVWDGASMIKTAYSLSTPVSGVHGFACDPWGDLIVMETSSISKYRTDGVKIGESVITGVKFNLNIDSFGNVLYSDAGGTYLISNSRNNSLSQSQEQIKEYGCSNNGNDITGYTQM